MQLGLACVASGLFAQNAGKSPKYVSERILAVALVAARFQVDADAKSKTPDESFVSHQAASLASFLQAAVQAFTRRQVHTSLLFLHFLRESPPESLIRFIKGGSVRLKGDASEWVRCRLCQGSLLRLRGLPRGTAPRRAFPYVLRMLTS